MSNFYSYLYKGRGEILFLFLIHFMKEKEETLKKIYQYLTSGDEELITLGLVMYGEYTPTKPAKVIFESVKRMQSKKGIAQAQIRLYFKRKAYAKISKGKL